MFSRSLTYYTLYKLKQFSEILLIFFTQMTIILQFCNFFFILATNLLFRRVIETQRALISSCFFNISLFQKVQHNDRYLSHFSSDFISQLLMFPLLVSPAFLSFFLLVFYVYCEGSFLCAALSWRQQTPPPKNWNLISLLMSLILTII